MMHKNGDMYYIPVTIDNIIEEGNMTRVVTKEGTAFYLTESEMEEAKKISQENHTQKGKQLNERKNHIL